MVHASDRLGQPAGAAILLLQDSCRSVRATRSIHGLVLLPGCRCAGAGAVRRQPIARMESLVVGRNSRVESDSGVGECGILVRMVAPNSPSTGVHALSGQIRDADGLHCSAARGLWRAKAVIPNG